MTAGGGRGVERREATRGREVDVLVSRVVAAGLGYLEDLVGAVLLWEVLYLYFYVYFNTTKYFCRYDV